MKKIKDFITIDILNEASLFGIAVIDLSNYNVIYTNKEMKKILADKKSKTCWESIYGESSPCKWCKVYHLSEQGSDKSITYDHFNEINGKWYQVENKIVDVNQELRVLIYFYVDISKQKEAQGELIQTHVTLSIQTNKLKSAQEELKTQAYRDPMTNLYNRRYFFEYSKELLETARLNKEHISGVMIDIDKFKNINDTYGHAIGDEVIKLLSSVLIKLTRTSDVVARIGGEEFAILFPNTTVKNAHIKAEKIRSSVEATALGLDDGKEIKFTVSIGVSYIQNYNDNSINDLLVRADNALYKAKESGRNMVI